jgi:hypothetical protein
MDKDLIAEIARQIVNEQILTNWRVYAVILCLGIISAACGAFGNSYLSKRGEHAATTADFDRLTAQLAEQVRVTKNIETSMSHSDWERREYRTVRRTKLEELMTALYEARQWVDENSNRLLWTEKPAGKANTPIRKVMMLSSLYFPEFSADAILLFDAHQDMAGWAFKTEARLDRVRREIASAREDGLMDLVDARESAKADIERDATDEYFPLYKSFAAAIFHIETSAAKVMGSVLGVDHFNSHVPGQDL